MTGRTAAYGRAAFGWAVKRGAVPLNPFADLPVGKSIAKRERVLSDAELAEIWRAAGEASAPYGAIVRLLILTGQRRGEVAGMAWNEISDDFATWNLPPHRTKNGVAHTVPLSGLARDALKELAATDASGGRGAELVFPGAAGTPFAGWSKSKRALDKAIATARSKTAPRGGEVPAGLMAWNVHDLRRTVATGLQRLGVRLEVTEAVLNHISGSRGGIAGVYQRHDWASEKRAALDSWAAHVLAAIKQKPPIDKVITLTRKKR
jgi:integrase